MNWGGVEPPLQSPDNSNPGDSQMIVETGELFLVHLYLAPVENDPRNFTILSQKHSEMWPYQAVQAVKRLTIRLAIWT